MITFDEAAQLAVKHPKVRQFAGIAAAVLKSSPTPADAFAWLASVEQDPGLKFGFEHAAELVRARDGGSRD